MSRTSTSTRSVTVQRVEPAEAALRFLPGASYADAFRTTGVPDAPARVWAKVCLASGPEIQNKIFGTLVWHGLLGLDIASAGTPNTMVGWHIEVDEPHLFVLTTGGTRMSGAMVFAVDGDTITWTTAVRYLHPSARTVWAGAQHVHRAVAKRLLGSAAQTITKHAAT